MSFPRWILRIAWWNQKHPPNVERIQRGRPHVRDTKKVACLHCKEEYNTMQEPMFSALSFSHTAHTEPKNIPKILKFISMYVYVGLRAGHALTHPSLSLALVSLTIAETCNPLQISHACNLLQLRCTPPAAGQRLTNYSILIAARYVPRKWGPWTRDTWRQLDTASRGPVQWETHLWCCRLSPTTLQNSSTAWFLDNDSKYAHEQQNMHRLIPNWPSEGWTRMLYNNI